MPLYFQSVSLSRCGALALLLACTSGSKGVGSSRSGDDDTSAAEGLATDTSITVGEPGVEDTDTGHGDDGGPTDSGHVDDTGSGCAACTVVELDAGDYTTLTASYEHPSITGGTSLGYTLALTSDIWGDGRPEVVSSSSYVDGYYGVATTYIFDSDYFSSGPKDGIASDEARIQIDTENLSGNSIPFVIGDIDGDGLDELALSPDGLGSESILLRGSNVAMLSGHIKREDLVADMTFTNCPPGYSGGFAFVYRSGYLSDLSGLSPDLVVDCFGTIVVAHTSGLADGIVTMADEGQVRIYNTDAWGGEPVVEDDRLGLPEVLGDLDGDGLDELGIAMGTTTAAYNYVFYGGSLDFENPTAVFDADITLAAPSTISWGDHYSYSFTTKPLGDVDGDGVADVLWCADYAEVGGRGDVGTAWLWSGSRLASPTVGDVGDADVTFTAEMWGASVGQSAADAGDADGDSLSDLLIHSTGYDPDDSDTPKPFVHLVRGAELSGGGIYNLEHTGLSFIGTGSGLPRRGSDTGEYVGGQDIDGDGVSDILIGNGDWSRGATGRIWMIPGGTLPL
jgi:hypothetical protein